MKVVAQAPGKLFLAGEYAVLHGGRAVITAVDRRLTCRVRVRAGTGRVELRSARAHLECRRQDLQPDRVGPELRYLAAATVVGLRVFPLAPPLDLEVSSGSGFEGETGKLGLGSSAAIVAATLAALDRLAAGAANDDALRVRRRLALGIAAHRWIQGSGSGVDVAAATIGGLVAVRPPAGRPPRSLDECLATADAGSGASSNGAQVEPLALPLELDWRAGMTGVAAASGPPVARFERLIDREVDREADRDIDRGVCRNRATAGDGVLTVWVHLAASTTEALIDACRRDDAAAAMDAFALAGRLLERLTAIAHLPTLGPAMRRALVRRTPGAVVKPSGAGGGDCAIALCRRDRCSELEARWRERSVVPALLRSTGEGASARWAREDDDAAVA